MSTRDRNKGSLNEIGRAIEESWHTNCAATSWVTNASTPVYGGDFKTMSDTAVPNFKKRQAAGEVFFNRMQSVHLVGQVTGSGGYYFKSKLNTCSSPAWKAEHRCTGPIVAAAMLPKESQVGQGGVSYPIPVCKPLITDAQINSLAGELSTELLNRRGRSDTNLWETLAEIDKTVAMLNEPIRKYTTVLNSAARAQQKGMFTGHALNGMSNLWLAYRYGILPIVRDIQGVIAGLRQKRESQRESTRVGAALSQAQTETLSATYGVLSGTVQRVSVDNVSIRAMSLDEFERTLMFNLGFSTKNLITLPWELVRYSFVADWAFNLGSFLGSVVPAFGWNQLGSCLVIKRVVTSNYDMQSCVMGPSGANYELVTPPSGGYQVTRTLKVRKPLELPRLTVKHGFNESFENVTRLADAMALIGQRTTRIFR